ncbi:transporter substrate-binding domain-containing protein [Ectopseudomonas mendocina]|uniref:Transporter substrate-binding domain-containing protein n=1 Tax=Ectopseudomonas mendocina TaxID=300 RepID=A0ABD7RYF8_ECTME|nr:transporter substrate-binding domain-containing protein [Pseudomonas mendocina]TRO16325.1 transporter substrate-binding domain-containing protein [Pseudomonas mendocina]TRO20076.1 transporter substrate-binding domain-containing protein [Pseudomonas mendocina]
MPDRHLFPCLLLLIATLAQASDEEHPTVRLDTSLEDPYQVVVDGELSGSSVTVLQCIFSRMHQPYQIQLTSLSRARQNVSRRIADGFFSSAPDTQVDGYAQLSAPLLMEKWYWYALEPQILNKPIWERDLRIGSVLGSNSMTWLEARGITVAQKVPRLEQLIELLQRGRIDLFLADGNVMRSALSQQPKQPDLQQRFVRYSPLGVYFSHDFLQQHPDFLNAFNRQVEHCAPRGSTLTDAEAHYLRQLTAQHLKRWAYHDELLNALRQAATRNTSIERIRELERQWQRERLLEEKPLIRRLLQAPASQLLANIARQHQPLFNEIFLSDQSGQLVAISEITSDYWQADEDDFQQAQRLAPGQVHIGNVEYDGSTQSFQSKVSAPIHDPEDGRLLGVLSLGINIETAFGDNLR